MINFNTDLADERRDIYRKANNISDEIPGIETEEKQIDENIKINKVIIKDEQGEEAIGKPVGTYITVNIKKLKLAEKEEIRKSCRSCNRRTKRTYKQTYCNKR